MTRQFIMHIDEAPYRSGQPRKPGEPIQRANQFPGDMERGPWSFISHLPGGFVSQPHSHTQDEFIFILEGYLTIGDRRCGPGTVIYNEKGSVYGFTVGEQGVRFLNIRPGKEGFSGIKYAGVPSEQA